MGDMHIDRKNGVILWYLRESDRGALWTTLELVQAYRQALVAPGTGPTAGVWQIHGGDKSHVYGVRGPGGDVCVKCYHDDRFWNRLRTFLGCGKGRSAFRRAVQLRIEGLPPVLGYAQQRPCGPGFLIMELAWPHERLDHRLGACRRLTAEAAIRARRELAVGLGRFAADLHRQGVAHRDFSTRNLLLLEGNRFLLADLEDIRILRRPSFSASLRDLRHLHEDVKDVLPRDRLRFLRSYALQLGKDASYGLFLARRIDHPPGRPGRRAGPKKRLDGGGAFPENAWGG